MKDGSAESPQDQGEVDEESVRVTVLRLVKAYAPNGIDVVDASSNLTDELGYNSMRIMELSFAVEELFGLESFTFTTGTPSSLGTVGQLQDFVLSMLASGQATAPTQSEAEQILHR